VNSDSFGPEAWSPLAKALVAYWTGHQDAVLLVHSDEGEPDPMPVALFFRGIDAMSEVDRHALELARGRVLDGGACVGSVTLALQDQGLEVVAVEVIPEAVEIMRSRGVEDPREGRLEDIAASQEYDTVLLLMNGAALAGTLSGLPRFLDVLDGLVAPGGQVLLDSTDLRERAVNVGESTDGMAEEYPGEFHYQVEFDGDRGAPFPQLFVDPGTLARVASVQGWTTEICCAASDGDYLSRLTRTAEKGED